MKQAALLACFLFAGCEPTIHTENFPEVLGQSKKAEFVRKPTYSTKELQQMFALPVRTPLTPKGFHPFWEWHVGELKPGIWEAKGYAYKQNDPSEYYQAVATNASVILTPAGSVIQSVLIHGRFRGQLQIKDEDMMLYWKDGAVSYTLRYVSSQQAEKGEAQELVRMAEGMYTNS